MSSALPPSTEAAPPQEIAVPAALDYANPYWDEVRDLVGNDPWYGGTVIAGPGLVSEWARRDEIVGRYAWTVTDPVTVAFVAAHCGRRVLDPLAGSGYWAFLLGQLGVDVVATDATPPSVGGNDWHDDGVEHVPVGRADALDSARRHGDGRTLLLSWPPYEDPIGERLLSVCRWDRVVYIGEGDGGWCGTDGMFEALDRDWRVVAERRPVQWWGLRDTVSVFERA